MKLKFWVNLILLVSIAVIAGFELFSISKRIEQEKINQKTVAMEMVILNYESLSASLSAREAALLETSTGPEREALIAGFNEKIAIRMQELKRQYGFLPHSRDNFQRIWSLVEKNEILFQRAHRLFKNGQTKKAAELLASPANQNLKSLFHKYFTQLIKTEDDGLAQQDKILGLDPAILTSLVSSFYGIIIIFICLLLFNSYMSQRELVESELRAAKEEAVRSSKAKSEFLSKMSHEIRTPLNALIGGADALADIPHSSEQGAYLRLMQKAGESLYSLVNQILDLAKIESGKVDIKSRTFNVRNLLSTIIDIFAIQAQQKGIDLRGNVAPDVPVYIEMDPDKLRQVLINLISNAVKFTQSGHVEVRLSTVDNHRLVFTIKDTGIGMTEEVQKKLFQKFSQGDDTITRLYGGSGLGLVITKELVSLMGGKIELSSSSLQGTEFRLFLPLVLGHKESSLRYYEGGISNPSTKRLLIVDDNEDNLHLLKLYLQKEKYDMTFARNGKEAFEIFQRERFDLVFMDVHMPVMDGYTATQKIRAWETTHKLHRTPVVALTADALKEDFDRSVQAGCNAHLTKPIKKNDLIANIEKFTHH